VIFSFLSDLPHPENKTEKINKTINSFLKHSVMRTQKQYIFSDIPHIKENFFIGDYYFKIFSLKEKKTEQ